MKLIAKTFIFSLLLLAVVSIVWASAADFTPLYVPVTALDVETVPAVEIPTEAEGTTLPGIKYIPFGVDTPGPGDSLPFPQGDDDINPFLQDPHSYWILNDPANVKTEVTYDPQTGDYNLSQKVGDDINFRPPTYMTSREYNEMVFDQQMRNYWRERLNSDNASEAQTRGLIPQIKVRNKVFETIFGSNVIDIRPNGSAEIILGYTSNRTQNPNLPINQQRIGALNFQNKIQMSVIGKIGDRIQLGTNYNTETGFAFDNKLNLKYEGGEDDIIKLIEFGNVSMPLTGSLIQGSQSLFGIKTTLQFGKFKVTALFSQQQGQKQTIELQGGAQTTKFEISASEYEANRHYFLGQMFREQYNTALAGLPVVISPVNITRIEVWVTNNTFAVDNVRNIVGLQDLGETEGFGYNPNINYAVPGQNWPRNEVNSLDPDILAAPPSTIRDISNTGAGTFYSNPAYAVQVDYEVLNNARMLGPQDYTLNTRLGYISLNQPLNNSEVLCVAYQYQYNGQVYQVGEFSNDGIPGQQALILKMLRSTNGNKTDIPMWNLMMKNVYSLGGYQIAQDNFQLNVTYLNPSTNNKINYLPEGQNFTGRPLIQPLGLDRLNNNNDPMPDGRFDMIEGITINKTTGRIYFPVVEPFGKDLRAKFQVPPDDPNWPDKYAFDALYNTTKPLAQLDAVHNRYYLSGQYQASSGSEISLNAMNIQQGSVTVTAGGVALKENVDFTVDYALGRVKIINEGIMNSGTPIKISLENNSLFNVQTRRLFGAHMDYQFSKDFALGATVMNLTERPITFKINIGDEPISNTIVGIDGTLRKDVPLLTRLLDKLPFYSTKAPSSISAQWEAAKIFPGHSKIIGKTGVSYIDDFEGAETSIDIRNFGLWFLASTPSGTGQDLFPEATQTQSNELSYGMNRALLAWYTVDPSFFNNNTLTPQHIADSPQEKSDLNTCQISSAVIFPNKQYQNGNIPVLPMLDLAFYPKERGPYNFDGIPGKMPYSAGLNFDGSLAKPETRWGGIMRRIETNDWEAANIDYIEFWMMDPFNSSNEANPNGIDPLRGGDLYFNVGNVSEDVLRDGRLAFENGIPADGSSLNIDTTIWGRYPTVTQLVNAFDNDPASREFQDVGYDCIGSGAELNHNYGLGLNIVSFTGSDYINALNVDPAVKALMQLDPANDNYHYFRGNDYDSQTKSIRERYKRYSMPEGNSPIGETVVNGVTQSAQSPLPNIEDINRDNTLSYAESYYQYKVSLRPADCMEIGKNYLTDILVAQVNTPEGNKECKFYQFRIPIRNYEKKVGAINDFRAIRFMRVFLKGWQDSVVCRFARLELVRGEWRRYGDQLLWPGAYVTPDPLATYFAVSTVNIEENGSKQPTNYQLPPDINREIDPTTTNLQRLNEQSEQLLVCNLLDGDARAIYKNTKMDMRAYKNLNMYVHCEAYSGNSLNNKDVSVFIRLGSDFDQNYYEVEAPMEVSSAGTIDANVLWPDENRLDFALDILQSVKQERNMITGYDINIPYTKVVTMVVKGITVTRRVTVRGVPNLGGVLAVMIGVRNPLKTDNPFGQDDGLPKCAEIWVNELRLSDYFENGGWAAVGRLQATLADLGTANFSISHTSFGFGNIDQRPLERSRNNTTQYDISSTLELGKFFPSRWGVSIPFFFNVGEIIANPQFNPLDPDIKFDVALQTAYATGGKAARDQLARSNQDYTKRRSFNFTNVRINRTGGGGGGSGTGGSGGGKGGSGGGGGKGGSGGGSGGGGGRVYPWSISNFDLTYAYNELYKRNINTEFFIDKNYMGALGYNYQVNNPKNFKPLDKVGFMKGKWWALLKDLNFTPMPQRISMRTDINRHYAETVVREVSNGQNDEGFLPLPPQFTKSYTWNRNYDVQWPITKSLQLNFRATDNARIDEPTGKIDTKEERDSILTSISRFGRNTNYTQSTDITYQVPINKIPLLNFVTSSANYSSTYTWTAASLDTTAQQLGNFIQNSRTMGITGQFNMVQLYNKIPYFKKIIASQNKKPATKKPANKKAAGDSLNVKKAPGDTLKKKKENDPEDSPLEKVAAHLVRAVLALKSVSFNYAVNEGTALPGYMPKSNFFGNDVFGQYGSVFETPGIPFVFGDQRDIRPRAVQGNWLTSSSLLNTQLVRTKGTNLNINATIEPFKDLRITLTATRTYNETYTSVYRLNDFGQYEDFNAMTTGNFSITTVTWATAFKGFDKDNNYASATFEQFLNYRNEIAFRQAQNNPNWDGTTSPQTSPNAGFPTGYGKTSQEVLVPAFLAAYTGNTARGQSLNLFPKIPIPNWRITYDGLAKIPAIKKIFKNFTINHSYRSTYNIGSFVSDLKFQEANNAPAAFNNDGDFISRFAMTGGVSITEQFGPLIGFDMTLQNSLLARFEIKKTRTLNLSINNNQLNEIINDEIVIGAGYAIKNVTLPIKVGPGGKKPKSDINLRVDVSIRNNLTITRKIVEQVNQATAGMKNISIKCSADYQLNSRFMVRLFFDRMVNKPAISSQFPTSTTNAGLSLRFTLAQ